MLKVWGSKGNRTGKFNNPSGIAVDSQSNVYAADNVNDHIHQFVPKIEKLIY